MRPHRRTTLAAILIGIAVLLPTGAWYVTGSREVARRSRRDRGGSVAMRFGRT